MILTDSDPFDDCVASSMRGVYQNDGQNCRDVERILCTRQYSMTSSLKLLL